MKIALVTISIVCCMFSIACSGSHTASGLPFYDGPDFTPRWTRPSSHTIGAFWLVDQTGQTFSREMLRDRIHVASFIYTHCAGVCPTMVQQLGRVQKSLAERPDVVMLSFTVTPQDDTPEQLAEFGKARGINADRWKLLTGDLETIYRLARESYFADDGRLDKAQAAAEQFLHTEKVLLVDRNGRLRGVYNGTLPYEIDKLVTDIDTLRSTANGTF
jgi:protein SCO1/2